MTIIALGELPKSVFAEHRRGCCELSQFKKKEHGTWAPCSLVFSGLAGGRAAARAGKD